MTASYMSGERKTKKVMHWKHTYKTYIYTYLKGTWEFCQNEGEKLNINSGMPCEENTVMKRIEVQKKFTYTYM